MFQVAVVIPVWNGEAVLGRCLAALARQTLPRAAYQVIVVDNGSSDATREIARSYLGVEPARRAPPGLLCGAQPCDRARPRADHRVYRRRLRTRARLARASAGAAAANPGFGVLAGKIELFDEIAQEREVFGDYERLFSFPQAHAARGNCATANWASETALLKALGGFDAALKSGGDRQMALRIRESGHPLVYVPAMVVRHPVRASRAEFGAQAAAIERWALGSHPAAPAPCPCARDYGGRYNPAAAPRGDLTRIVVPAPAGRDVADTGARRGGGERISQSGGGRKAARD